MVRDNQLQPKAFGLFRLVQAGDAAIDGDDQRDAGRRDLAQGLVVEAVALVEPARHVQIDLGAEQAEALEQEGGAADAVHVVVAVDAEAAALAHGLENARGRFGRAGQQFRGVQAGQRRVEKAPRVLRRTQTAVEQQLGGDRRQPQRGRQPGDGVGVVRQQAPGFGQRGGQGFDPSRLRARGVEPPRLYPTSPSGKSPGRGGERRGGPGSPADAKIMGKRLKTGEAGGRC